MRRQGREPAHRARLVVTVLRWRRPVRSAMLPSPMLVVREMITHPSIHVQIVGAGIWPVLQLSRLLHQVLLDQLLLHPLLPRQRLLRQPLLLLVGVLGGMLVHLGMHPGLKLLSMLSLPSHGVAREDARVRRHARLLNDASEDAGWQPLPVSMWQQLRLRRQESKQLGQGCSRQLREQLRWKLVYCGHALMVANPMSPPANNANRVTSIAK